MTHRLCAPRGHHLVRPSTVSLVVVTQLVTHPAVCRGHGPELALLTWSGWPDLNRRPLRPERSALPSCATPRRVPERREVPGEPGTPGSLADPRNQREQGCLRPAAEPEGCPRRGPEPARDVQPRAVRLALHGMPVQAAHTPGFDAAVGDQGPDPRQAYLPAVGVAGEQQVVAVGGEPGHYPRLGRVHDAEPQVSGGIGGPSNVVVPVPADVRVVHTAHLDVQIPGLDPAALIVHFQPAGRRHCLTQLGTRQIRRAPVAVRVVALVQVEQRVLGDRRIYVVRAVYEDAPA